METLQRWVLLLCCGAILYGVVENLLPRQGTFPVIKAVAVLYIVLILLSPAKSVGEVSLELPEVSQDLSVSMQEPEQTVLNRSAVLIKEFLTQELCAAGLDAPIEAVTLSETDGTVRVLFCADEGTEQSAVERLCDEKLGVKGIYEWKSG